MMDVDKLERIGKDLVQALGGDLSDPHIADTPRRWARMWEELLDPQTIDSPKFEPIVSDQLVAVTGIEAWSICAHHLLPFRLVGTCAYLVDGHMIGASKLVRAFRAAAGRLATQELVVDLAASEIRRLAGTDNVAVFAVGYHLCMAMRGVRSNARMITSRLMGAFKHDSDLRAELLRLISIAKGEDAF